MNGSSWVANEPMRLATATTGSARPISRRSACSIRPAGMLTSRVAGPGFTRG